MTSPLCPSDISPSPKEREDILNEISERKNNVVKNFCDKQKTIIWYPTRHLTLQETYERNYSFTRRTGFERTVCRP
jgi:hypothetical protein